MDSMTKVVISGSNNVIYTNKNDQRGQWLINNHGVTQPLVTRLWRKIVETVNPTIVVDVGVNYGEILLSTSYSKEAQIIGIEANRELAPFLNKSIMEHPNKGQVQIIHAIASDKDRKEMPFYIDQDWSGVSSIIPNSSKKEQKIRSVKVDTIFSDVPLINQNLIFKIDVEGYEEYVLKGMNNLFKNSAKSIGLIEFNNNYLQEAGTNIEEFLNFLSSNFSVYYPNKNQLIKFTRLNSNVLYKYFKKRNIHADFLLSTNEEVVSKLDFKVKEYPRL